MLRFLRAVCLIPPLAVAGWACGSRGLPTDPAPCPPGAVVDADGDGEAAAPCGGDCDDADPSRYPGAADAMGDGVDDNCDGVDGVDVDRDGHPPLADGGDDCDDQRATVHPGANDNQGWVVEQVPGDGGGAIGLTLAVDPAGVAHIAGSDGLTCTDPEIVSCWGREGGEAVYWVTNRDGVWATHVVESSGIGSIFGTIGAAVVPSGGVLISYLSAPSGATSQAVRLARCGSGACSVEVVARAGVEPPGGDVAVAQDGTIFVAYGALEPASAGVSISHGDAWTIERWSEADPGGMEIVVGPRGAYAAYYVGRATGPAPHFDVRVAHRSHGRWHEDVIATAEGVFDVALALDPSGEPSVAYSAYDGTFVVSGGQDGWRQTKVTAAAGARISMASDSRGAMHLAWADGHAHHATDVSGEWVVEELGVGALYAAIAVDSFDVVHIAYAGRGIEYGTLQPIDGVDENCDGVDGVDADGDGHPSRATGGDDPDDADPRNP